MAEYDLYVISQLSPRDRSTWFWKCQILRLEVEKMIFRPPREAFWSVSARCRAKSMTRRAETGSFSASARRVISEQSEFSFHWLRQKVVNLTIQLRFWRWFMLRLVVSHMLPSQIFIELWCGWVWLVCHYSGVAQRPKGEILKISVFEDFCRKADSQEPQASIIERCGGLPRKVNDS